MGDGWDGVPADAFVAILLRIPLAPRRRLRLVCRHWRDVIDERTPPEPPRTGPNPKVLVFTRSGSWSGSPSRAYVLDEQTAGRSGRELDLQRAGVYDADANVRMIGTCNGLLCFLRRERGDIVVVNPATQEMVAVDFPPAWCYGADEKELAYTFGYHPATGQYKIVHVRAGELRAVHVFTLGGGGWREVPAPAGSSCHLGFGIVTVDGVSYWITRDSERIISFDLKDERVAVVESPPLPVPLPKESLYGRPSHLTNVRGSVGIAVWRPNDEFGRSKTEVWVLEGGKEEERAWAKRYTLLAHGVYPRQEIARPHVEHGEHVLTTCEHALTASELWSGGLRRLSLNACRPRDERKMRACAMVRVGAPRAETVVGMYDGAKSLRTFAYVETREPVLVYADNSLATGVN
ncbi:unnamed protein product [Urochloa humidicola]